MAAERNTCSGDCMNCSIIQRGYCASQLSYNNMNTIASLQKSVSSLEEKLNALSEKTELIKPK